MPPLMGLISVQPTSRLPLTFHIFSFLSRKDADERRAWRVGLESYDQTCAGKDKLIRPCGDRQPSGNRVRRLSALCRRRGRAFVGYVQRVTAQPRLLRRPLLGALRQKAGHLILPLMIENQRRELGQNIVTAGGQAARRLRDRLNTERAEADRVVLAYGVERIDRAQRSLDGFGNEERIAGLTIFPAPLREIREVDVRR